MGKTGRKEENGVEGMIQVKVREEGSEGER